MFIRKHLDALKWKISYKIRVRSLIIMAKTKEELQQLKKECEALNNKLKELTEDELKEVTGGISAPWSETIDLEELNIAGGQHQR